MVRQKAVSDEIEGMEGFNFFYPSHKNITQVRILKEVFSIFCNQGEEISATFNIVANIFPHVKESIIFHL